MDQRHLQVVARWEQPQTCQVVVVPSPHHGMGEALRAAYRTATVIPDDMALLLARMEQAAR